MEVLSPLRSMGDGKEKENIEAADKITNR